MPVSIWKVVVLPAPLGPSKPDDFAALQLQRDVFDHPASGERLHQMLRRKHGLLFESLRCRARIRRRSRIEPAAALLAFSRIL